MMRRGKKRQNEIPAGTFPSTTIVFQSVSGVSPPSILTFATLPPSAPATLTSSTFTSSPTATQTPAPSETPSPPSTGVPLSTLIPAVVVPVVVLALVAPIALYFFLTRHDRKRSKSHMDSRVSSRAYPDSRIEPKSPIVTNSSSETGVSKSSEIMNFDLGPGIEKPLPVVNVTGAPDGAEGRPDHAMLPRGMQSPIGQAISRYSGSHDSYSHAIDVAQNRTSVQELSEENMRIARFANDSKVSFRGREPDEVSDVSAPAERTSRHVGRRETDELSDVSSMYEDVTVASSDRGGGILGNNDARRSGPFR